MASILNAVFDRKFHEFSHGFREGHSQHMALHELREQCREKNINWIVDADVSGFFDNIDKKLLLDMVKQRVNDGGILRLIGKWLQAGVDESGDLQYPEKGTPQGGLCKALHKPPYAKLTIMQSKSLEPLDSRHLLWIYFA